MVEVDYKKLYENTFDMIVKKYRSEKEREHRTSETLKTMNESDNYYNTVKENNSDAAARIRVLEEMIVEITGCHTWEVERYLKK